MSVTTHEESNEKWEQQHNMKLRLTTRRKGRQKERRKGKGKKP
jgi:hypothetical protein